MPWEHGDGNKCYTAFRKTLRRGRQFVNKGTLLRYSLSTTKYIVSSVANQRTAFVIDLFRFILIFDIDTL